MKKRILIVGAGGHARVVSSVIDRVKLFSIVGFLDRRSPRAAERIRGYGVIGSFKEAATLHRQGVRYAALALGDNRERSEMMERLSTIGFSFPPLVHPTAIVERDATVRDGALVCAGAIVATCASLGRGSIVNTGTIVDHESVVGDFAHLAPGVNVAGRVTIGRGCFVGIGASIADQTTIGDWTIVGAGSVVLKDLRASVTAYGVPAKERRPSR